MNQATTIMIEGQVQRVGFRPFAEQLARNLKLTGYVENMKDGRVKIFVQGIFGSLERFETEIRGAPLPIIIDNITRKKSKTIASLKYFQIKSSSLTRELQEGFGGMETQFKDYREEFKDYRKEFRDYREEFRSFAGRTDTNFQSLDKRYGEISSKLTEILDALRTENRQALIELKETTRALLEAVSKISDRK